MKSMDCKSKLLGPDKVITVRTETQLKASVNLKLSVVL